MWTRWILLATAAAGFGACAVSPPRSPSPVWEFALRYEPAPAADSVVPCLPEVGSGPRAELDARPPSRSARRAVALVGTRLYRYHVEWFGQAYELRQGEPNAFLLAFAELSGRDIEGPEFLPSSTIHDWVLSQADLAGDPLLVAETERIESALRRDRW